MLAIVLMVGFGTQSSHAAVICIDLQGACNDYKLFISPDTGGGIRAVNGYEYGCGQNDRGISGTMRVTPTSKIFTLTGSNLNGSTLKIEYYSIDKITKTGLGGWSYNNGTYWNGVGTYSIVPCPLPGAGSVEAAEMTEPDTSNP